MVGVRIYDAAELDRDEWQRLHTLQRDAFSSTLDRSQAEIDTLVGWNEPSDFYVSHINPNAEVGGRFAAGQSYFRPRVAVAAECGEPVGFAYSAHNVSGSTEHERFFKRLSLVKNYLWLREIAVKPDFQNMGVAKDLGRALLKDAIFLQPPTAYVWPDEAGVVHSALERLGFAPTDEQQVQIFGENSSPVRQVRLQAPSVRSVLQNL